MMKFLKNSLFTLLTAFIFMGASATLHAQSQNSAYDAYNRGIELASAGNYQQAIEAYKQAISLAEEMGADGQEIVNNAQDALPRLYYQSALSVYQSFQQSPSVAGMNEAISAFETAAEMANQYGNSDIASQAEGVITQLYYQKAKVQMQTGDYSGALAAINTAIERNPDNARAYYRKATIIKNQESSSVDQYLAAIDTTIVVAVRVGDAQIERMANEGAADQLVYRGAQRVAAENYSGAINILERALEYNPESVNAYYRIAQAYNAQGDYSQALQAAQQALQYANGGAAAQAKIYFAMGEAYKGMGQYNQACDAYANANYGRFRSSVQHTMDFVLKCE